MISSIKFILNSLLYYRRAHLAVIIGAAISTMVLTGTLIVGDSIEASLEKTTEYRLGKITYMFSGVDRYFRSDLADEIRKEGNYEVASIISLSGIASSQGGTYQVNKVDVLGIDEHFNTLIPGESLSSFPGPNEAFISENLANRLQLKTGDPFLLKLQKASLIPQNAPFVSDADNRISLRLKVAHVLGIDELGRFNLKTSQTAPFNVFLSLPFLNGKMGTGNKANRLLFAESPGLDEESVLSVIQENWEPEDLGLNIISVNDNQQWEIRSERIFIDSVVIQSAAAFEKNPIQILTYFANSLKNGDRETPYSFVSAGPFNNTPGEMESSEILINQWLAEDLKVKPGDSVEISYFIVGPLRKLEETSRWFIVKDIVPQSGIYNDQDLMPALPGLTDAGNCSDWDTGIPINLDKIRDKDEDYWNDYKGTPKAFISYPVGKELWENRFGSCTAIRFSSEDHTLKSIKKALKANLDPKDFGFTLKSVKSQGLSAAAGGVDFAQLFMGLSFFLLVAGLILMSLLFSLNLEKRISQAGTLKAIGYPAKLIRRLFLVEGLIVAIPGVLLGILLAILYNRLIFKALNTVWFDIVRTSVLQEHVLITTLITGAAISLVLAWGTMYIHIYRKLKSKPADLQRSLLTHSSIRLHRWIHIGGWIIGIFAFGLLSYEVFFGKTLNTTIFFSSGGLLLVSFILLVYSYLQKEKKSTSGELSLSILTLHNLQRNKSRSLRIVILFALGTFVIVSTGLNRKDLHSGAGEPTSGTGGFLFYGETTLPVLLNLNEPDGKLRYGLEMPLDFVQMRKNEGDDASCLNLNRITQPRILGVPAEKLENRFSFVKSTDDLDPGKPWSSLKNKLPGGVIPAIADQTVIQWGLGMKVGDTLIYKDELGQEMKLKLIGGLANSIFQGNVLIDESHFLKHFPTHSGTHIFLVDGSSERKESAVIELTRSFRNEGLDLEDAAYRLTSFSEVENTYLSIFMILGGLAMILGTVGLGVSLARNILDRQREIAILRAIGYHTKTILNLLTGEHMILLGIGTLIGTATALIATLPSILSTYVQASWQTAVLIILLILINGLIWILLITKSNLKKNLLISLRTE